MAKVSSCPACGAPLSPEKGQASVECFYCKRRVDVEERTPPANTNPTPRPVAAEGRRRHASSGANKKTLLNVLGVAAVVIFSVGGWYLEHRQATLQATPATDESTPFFRKLSLTASHEQVKAALGPYLPQNASPARMTLDFPAGSRLRRAELARELPGQAGISGIVVYSDFNVPAAMARIKKLVPHRVEEGTANFRVLMGDAVLDVERSYAKVWHFDSVHPQNADYARCAERLAAMWAVGRAALLEGDAPTAAELALVNGPKLSDVAALDTNVTVEQVVDEVQKKLPAAWCRMQAGLMCVVDIDDALVSDVHLTWPNALRARLQQLRLKLPRSADAAAARAIAGCLEPALGAGEEKVVDYVRGTRTFTWSVSGGDKKKKLIDTIVLGNGYLTVDADASTPADQGAAWTAKMPALFAALQTCRI